MFDDQNRYVIHNYQKMPEFASFLPGIAGKAGVPLWSFYVNRGQAITSFGSEDKEHSIMEFHPAQQSWQLVPALGFRTFLKIRGRVLEPFRDPHSITTMHIGMNELEIEDHSFLGLTVRVLYFILPDENLGGLVRRVEIENNTDRDTEIAVLDGMPSLIPYGISLSSYKEMGQTMRAWMQVEGVEHKTPYYRVRFSTKDGATVSRVEEGNYFLAVSAGGELLPVVADPTCVFGTDTGLLEAMRLEIDSVEEILGSLQVLENQVPCAFTGGRIKVGKGEKRHFYEVFGQAGSKEILEVLAARVTEPGYFENKLDRARELAEDLTAPIETLTGDPVFNGYCRQTFLDNLLRGGSPVSLTGDGRNIFYTCSRKHGDLERDYNFFRVPPQPYSQGNGNYRDVNQNRRCDNFFFPDTGDFNIRLFMNLIQLDGYNPLVLQPVTYRMKNAGVVLSLVGESAKQEVARFLEKPFAPGDLVSLMRKINHREPGTIRCREEDFLKAAIEGSECDLQADFSEGYWSDHWTYNLDLIENFLEAYPERGEELLYGAEDYTWYRMRKHVLPRKERYERTENGLRQYHFLEDAAQGEGKGQMEETPEGVLTSDLMSKLFVLASCKVSMLDPEQLGVEMEGGRPGWYDALNGLPALFGSSLAETYELTRLVRFLKDMTDRHSRGVRIPEQTAAFVRELVSGLEEYVTPGPKSGEDRSLFWNRANRARERYRAGLKAGVQPEKTEMPASIVRNILSLYLGILEDAVIRAVKDGDGLPVTYYRYEIRDFEEQEEKILFHGMKRIPLPPFLEGAVHYMKLLRTQEDKKNLYDKVRESGLFDRKLEMYKVCDSLKEEPFEIGRCTAFVPGWLENESIWLHMEYKYILELLKAGLYEEFLWDFRRACVPFLPEDTYGRSPLENSSFIVSSANPNSALHGRGFVARLSGSTAEFLEMWKIMMFGREPVVTDADGNRKFRPKPLIPEYLIGDRQKISARFMGHTLVSYYLSEKKDYIPGQYELGRVAVWSAEGTQTYENGKIPPDVLARMDEGRIREVEIELV